MPDAEEAVAGFAEALTAIGEATGRLDDLADEMDAVAAAVGKEEGLLRFLADPRVTDEGKESALKELLAGRVSPLALRLVLLLHAEGRLSVLDRIVEALFDRVAERMETSTGELVTACPIPAEKRAAIEREAGRILNRRVSLRERVDPDLLGGVRLRVGNTVLDGTVERRLDEVRRRLLA